MSVEAAPQALMFHKAQGQAINRESERETDAQTIETVVARLPATRGSRWVPINPMHPGDGGLFICRWRNARSIKMS